LVTAKSLAGRLYTAALMPVALALLGVQSWCQAVPADTSLVWVETFETGEVAGWRIVAEGDVRYEITTPPEGRFGTRCLKVWGSVPDEDEGDNRLFLYYDFRANGIAPLIATDSTVLQFEWWFSEDIRSGPVTIGLTAPGGRDRYITQFGSHSRFAYGYLPLVLGDPAGNWMVHRIARQGWAHLGTSDQSADTVTGVQIEVRYPLSQTLLLDNISIGPAALVRPLPEPDTVVAPPKPAYYSAAVEDIDGDGHLDIFIPSSIGAEVYMGREGYRVSHKDEAGRRGLDQAFDGKGHFADFDNDGDQDLLFLGAGSERPMIYENTGHGYFAPPVVCCAAGRTIGSVVMMCAGDFDNDGDLDVYMPDGTDVDKMLLNVGSLRFEEADTSLAPTLSRKKRAQGATATDMDSDGDLDLYLGSVGFLVNDGRGRFSLKEIPWHGFYEGVLAEGGAIGDLNGDGNLDLYVCVDRERRRTDLPNANLLYWGDGRGSFEMVDPDRTALADTGHCESALVEDFDNDGDMDAFVANRSSASLCYLNQGNGEFTNPEDGPLPRYYEYDTQGAVSADLDSDGNVDVLCISRLGGWRILRNSADRPSYIKFRLLGTRSNWDAVGSRITLFREDVSETGAIPVAVREVRSTHGYQFSGPKEVYIGLPDDGPFEAHVRFPSGIEITRSGLGPGATLTLVESQGFASGLFWSMRRLWLPQLAVFLHRINPEAAYTIMAACALLIGLLTPAGKSSADPARRRKQIRLFLPIGSLAAVLIALLIVNNRQAGGGAAYALMAGSAALGIVVTRLRSSRRPVGSASEIWDTLNDELLSYRHTEWSENLASLARLGGGLASDALSMRQKQELRAHWNSAVNLFTTVTADKLKAIFDLASSLPDTQSTARIGWKHLADAETAMDGDDVQAVVDAVKPLIAVVDRLADTTDEHLSCRYAEAISAALQASKGLIKENSVEVRTELDLASSTPVRIRVHELTAIVQDVLRNAVEAMVSADTRTVTIKAREDIDRVTLEVLDTGTGMPAMDPERLFEKGMSTKPQGSGFGLYYARRVLRRYKGDIALSRRTGAGGVRVEIVLKRADGRKS
jgi:signal transduction histidine kinase